MALLIGAIVVVILIVLLASGTIPVLAKGTVIVTLKDEETGKPIGRVNGDYVRVLLGCPKVTYERAISPIRFLPCLLQLFMLRLMCASTGQNSVREEKKGVVVEYGRC